MKAFTQTMVLGLALLSAAATVGATETQKPPVSVLEHAREAAAWRARNEKGFARDQFREQERRLQELIDAINQGAQVDPDDVDRALRAR